MRFSALLLALGLAGPALASSGPPGYHAPRRYYTIGTHRPYHRPPPRVHVSGNLGYYNGDLTSRYGDQTFRPGIGIGITQVKSPRISFTADLALLYLKAKDQYPERGLSFEGKNTVLTGMARYNLWADKSLFASLSQQATPVTVFVQAGVGALLYRPLTYQGTDELPPETGEKYPALAVILPVGGGITYHFASRWFLTLDGRYNFTSTDLLDGVSQRANPNRQDDYGTLTLQLEYQLGRHHGKPLVRND